MPMPVHAVVAALIAVAACKSADPATTPATSSGAAPANEPSPIVAAPRPEGTVVFLGTTMSALVLGCATVDGGVTGDKAVCRSLVRSGDALGDRYGRVLNAGESGKGACTERAGSTSYVSVADVALPEDYAAPKIGSIDPATDLYVYPASRAKDLVLATLGDDGALDRKTAAAILRREVVRLTANPDDRTVSSQPKTRAHLRADLDGDGADDTVWGVEGRPDDEFGVNGLFATLSRSGGLVALQVKMTEWQEPLAAIDLDGDGAAELIHVSHYAAAETTTVSRIVDGALVPVGACCCTEP